MQQSYSFVVLQYGGTISILTASDPGGLYIWEDTNLWSKYFILVLSSKRDFYFPLNICEILLGHFRVLHIWDLKRHFLLCQLYFRCFYTKGNSRWLFACVFFNYISPWMKCSASRAILPARWVPYSLSEMVGLMAALAASRDLSKLHFSTGGVKSNFSPSPLTSFSRRRAQFSSHKSLYTNLSGRRGEIQVSLCLNHRVSLGKNKPREWQHLSPSSVKRETTQNRQGRAMWTKAEQMEDHPLLGPQEVPTCWAWSCWRIFWQHGPLTEN